MALDRGGAWVLMAAGVRRFSKCRELRTGWVRLRRPALAVAQLQRRRSSERSVETRPGVWHRQPQGSQALLAQEAVLMKVEKGLPRRWFSRRLWW